MLGPSWTKGGVGAVFCPWSRRTRRHVDRVGLKSEGKERGVQGRGRGNAAREPWPWSACYHPEQDVLHLGQSVVPGPTEIASSSDGLKYKSEVDIWCSG